MEKIRIQFTLFSAFYSPLISAMSAGFLKAEGLDPERVHQRGVEHVPAAGERRVLEPVEDRPHLLRRPERQRVLDHDDDVTIKFSTGTINMNAVTASGDIASVTTTSGLSWKIPGRVGDSPIIGAGQYCDNGVGAAGSTGC